MKKVSYSIVRSILNNSNEDYFSDIEGIIDDAFNYNCSTSMINRIYPCEAIRIVIKCYLEIHITPLDKKLKVNFLLTHLVTKCNNVRTKEIFAPIKHNVISRIAHEINNECIISGVDSSLLSNKTTTVENAYIIMHEFDAWGPRMIGTMEFEHETWVLIPANWRDLDGTDVVISLQKKHLRRRRVKKATD